MSVCKSSIYLSLLESMYNVSIKKALTIPGHSIGDIYLEIK